MNPLQTIEPKRSSGRLCNIDLLRGLAAISVIFWHYQHFYYPSAGIHPPQWMPETQPMFASLSWLYLHGGWAVAFFWILSGFVFFHVYGSQPEISFKEFIGNRLSRLYPLHFITLCIVAALQSVSWLCLGNFQIYPENDTFHFLLNLLFVSHWGFQKGWSFNAPIWSISVEILTYGSFFLFLKSTKIGTRTSLIWFAWALILHHNAPIPIFECASFFALGGVINQLNAYIESQKPGYSSIALPLCVGLLSAVLIKRNWLSLEFGIQWFVFPSTIWLAAALEGKKISSGKLGSALGAITYSSYLLHVPTQILIIILLDRFIGNREVVNSVPFLAIYTTCILALAGLTYRFIELPLKVACRKLF